MVQSLFSYLSDYEKAGQTSICHTIDRIMATILTANYFSKLFLYPCFLIEKIGIASIVISGVCVWLQCRTALREHNIKNYDYWKIVWHWYYPICAGIHCTYRNYDL
eukprot:UN25142